MRRADRLLQIIQIMRRRKGVVRATELAEELEVSQRTIYRDMATLMASSVPITGEARMGYVLEPGYDMPPLMLTASEVEALALGLRLVGAVSQDDPDLLLAAGDAFAKIEAVLSAERKQQLAETHLVTGVPNMEPLRAVDMRALRSAMRGGNKLRIGYQDAEDETSDRVVWPLGLAYFGLVRMLIAWCELRNSIRHFRLDRIQEMEILAERAPHTRHGLYREHVRRERERGMHFLT